MNRRLGWSGVVVYTAGFAQVMPVEEWCECEFVRSGP